MQCPSMPTKKLMEADVNNPDDLLRSYFSGIKNDQVVSEIDRMAWAAFHDPWEAKPAPVEASASIPMLLSMDRLMAFMTRHGVEAVVYTELGCVDACFIHEAHGTITLSLGISTDSQDALAMKMVLSKPIPAERLMGCLALCNLWNTSYPYPRAAVHASASGLGHLMLDELFSFPAGVSDAHLDSLVLLVLQSCFHFWDWRLDPPELRNA